MSFSTAKFVPQDMSTLTISMPEGLAKQLQVSAAEEGVTVDQFIASAAGEKLSALMTLECEERYGKASLPENLIGNFGWDAKRRQGAAICEGRHDDLSGCGR